MLFFGITMLDCFVGIALQLLGVAELELVTCTDNLQEQ
jgi:hypothetical protein